MIFMKKGFTLVEVLAVIVILGLLVVIISPVVNNLLGDSEDALYDKQVDSIVKATKKYMVEHSELLPENSDSKAIYINDLIDNGVIDKDKVINPKTKEEMNGCVVVSYNHEFNQYEYNYKDSCTITITFDPEGGSVSTTSKEVMIGKPYGELPTPTRDGYRFLGWSGKNMLSKDNTTNDNNANHTYIAFQDNSIIFDASNVEGNSMSWIYLMIYKDKTRVLDGYKKTNVLGFYSNVLDSNDQYQFNRIVMKINTSKADAYMRIKNVFDENKKYTISFNVDELDFDHARAVISNLQLEEGEVATEYEPFKQYSSDTIVDKGSDYVMHAIWEVAS